MEPSCRAASLPPHEPHFSTIDYQQLTKREVSGVQSAKFLFRRILLPEGEGARRADEGEGRSANQGLSNRRNVTRIRFYSWLKSSGEIRVNSRNSRQNCFGCPAQACWRP
jgi:hypothetical protein